MSGLTINKLILRYENDKHGINGLIGDLEKTDILLEMLPHTKPEWIANYRCRKEEVEHIDDSIVDRLNGDVPDEDLPVVVREARANATARRENGGEEDILSRAKSGLKSLKSMNSVRQGIEWHEYIGIGKADAYTAVFGFPAHLLVPRCGGSLKACMARFDFDNEMFTLERPDGEELHFPIQNIRVLRDEVVVSELEAAGPLDTEVKSFLQVEASCCSLDFINQNQGWKRVVLVFEDQYDRQLFSYTLEQYCATKLWHQLEKITRSESGESRFTSTR